MSSNPVDEARAAVRPLLEIVKLAHDRGSGHLTLRHSLLTVFLTSEHCPEEEVANALHLVSEGDHDARIALHTALWGFVDTGLPIPQVLRPYVFDLLNVGKVFRGKPGVRGNSYFSRNELIRQAVALVMRYGFNATRNPATADKGIVLCACSIISEDLMGIGISLSEDEVRKIYEKRPARRRSARARLGAITR
jgi:hypothetical protein